ncbi:family 16 glycoside hydrolase [Novipirellula sp. SH528]|uniref:family 16 glycoside hydrolase n=1 Tax=Novipirellula sp. SH528 TaxID=3454466 RepID=UPI003F9F6087
MPSITKLRFLSTWAMLTMLVASAANADEYGTLLFSDDFERNESQELKDEPGNNWTTSSDKTAAGAKQVDLRDGAMHMHTAKNANHAVSVRQAFEFTDGTIGLRFRLDNDGDRLQLNFADMSLKSVHAGHLFDVIVGLDKVSFEDKKTGFMNLKIRAANQAGTLSSDEKAKLLKTKRKSISHPITKGQWHELRVHIAGDQITAVIDGNEVGSFQSEGIAHPTKGLLRLLTPGHSVVDDVKIWKRN